MHPIITILGRIKMYKGVYTALVTPFTQDNKILSWGEGGEKYIEYIKRRIS